MNFEPRFARDFSRFHHHFFDYDKAGDEVDKFPCISQELLNPYLSCSVKIEIQTNNKFCVVLYTFQWARSTMYVPSSDCEVIWTGRQ